MSILKVNDIRRATKGSAALVINDPIIITTGSISASTLIGSLPGGVNLADASVGKEKLTNDARDWVNILNKPAGIVSSSTQIIPALSGSIITPASITASSTIATRGTFSGSGALLYSIPNSALTNNSITINGVATALGTSRTLNTSDISESVNLYYTDARVKAKLNLEGIVSSSGQINYQSVLGQPSVNTLGSDGNKSFTVTAGIFLTGSTGITLNTDALNAKIILQTAGGTVSSSTQVKEYLPNGTVSSSGQVSYLQLSNIPGGIVSSSGQVDVRNTTGITTIATTGSNTFNGNQTISGSITLTGNLNVFGSSSVLYTTSSQLNVGLNKITIGTDQALRFGGLSVVDSGSANHSGSLYWDSINNHWIYENVSTAPYNSAILIAGPKNTGPLGNEIGLTVNKIPVASGEDHISDSQISDNGSIVGITGNLRVTGSITASGVSGVNYSSLTNIPSGIVSSSGQVRANQTNNFTSDVQQVLRDTNVHSGSFLGTATTNNLTEGFTNLYYTDARVKTKMNADAVHSGSFLGTATTTNLTEGTNLYFTNQRVLDALPINTLSSSIQVRDFLPANTVSSSAQINLSQAFNTASQALTASYALVTVGTTATNTDSLPQGTTNLYYSDTLVKNKLNADNVHSGSFLGTATTTNLTEGINLYFTNGRVINALPIGTVSSSTQISNGLPTGVVSASSQIDVRNTTGIATIARTGSNTFVGNQTISGSIFTNADTLEFTGTMTVSGSLGVTGSINNINGGFTGSFSGSHVGTFPYASLTGIPSNIVSSSTQFNALSDTSASFATTANNLNGGTTSYIPLWNSTTEQSSSNIFQTSGRISINTVTPSVSSQFFVSGSGNTVTRFENGGGRNRIDFVLPSVVDGSTIRVASGSTAIFEIGGAGGVSEQNYLRTRYPLYIQDISSNTLVTFTTASNVGIGTASPNAKLDILGSDINDVGIAVRNVWGASSTALLSLSSSVGEVFKVDRSGNTFANGNTGIGIIPSASLHVSGTTMVQQIIEKVVHTGSAPISVTNLDVMSGSLHYRSGSTTTHWTLNFRGAAGTTLNSMMYNNQSLTVALIVNQGATVYSASAHQIDGVSVTPRWQGGLVPTSSANSTDIYTYTIIKLASASYNVFASQTRFA